MKIPEFIEKYCKDIVENINKISKDPLDDAMFSYDTYVTLDDGKKEKALLVSDLTILVRDIIEYEEKDFFKKYDRNREALDAYRRYLSSFEILYGLDVIEKAKKLVQSSVSKMNDASGYNGFNILDGIM